MSLQQGRKINASKAVAKLKRKYLSEEIINEIKERKKLRKELL